MTLIRSVRHWFRFECLVNTLLVVLVLVFIQKNFLSKEQSGRFAYRDFFVQANSYPYGDSRNIQVAAHCRNSGVALGDLYLRGGCVKQGVPSGLVYEGISVPDLNYPPIWVRLYSYLDPEKESHLHRWGRLNGWALTFCVLLFCVRGSVLLFPLLILSPPVLLCMERGNTDGIVFAVLFGGLYFARSNFIRGAVISLAACLKFFPILALLGYIRSGWGWLVGGFLVFSIPFVESLKYLREILGATPIGYESGFGLRAFSAFPGLVSWLTPFVLQLGVVCVAVGVVVFSIWSERGRGLLDFGLTRHKKDIVLVSLLLFVLVYLLSFSWAYRVVFIAPAALLLATAKVRSAKIFALIFFFVIWSPSVFGWRHFGIFSTVLFWAALFMIPRLMELAPLRGASRAKCQFLVERAGKSDPSLK